MLIPKLKGIHTQLTISDRRKQKNHRFTCEHYERRNYPYELVHVDTPYLFNIFAKLRHQVYIEEERIPPAEISTIKSTISNLEIDEHDEHSDHYLLIFRPLDLYIGGIRLILPDRTKPLGGIRPLQLSKQLLTHLTQPLMKRPYF